MHFVEILRPGLMNFMLQLDIVEGGGEGKGWRSTKRGMRRILEIVDDLRGMSWKMKKNTTLPIRVSLGRKKASAQNISWTLCELDTDMKRKG